MPSSFRAWVFMSITAAAALVVTASCTGFQLESEKKERARVAESEKSFIAARPPVLSSTSSESDFMRFAMMNSPKVRSTFFEWKAAMEAVAAARSLPDPKIEFETDITDTMMTAMPGIMTEYTLPEKRAAAGDYAALEARRAYFEFRKSALESVARLMSAWADVEFYKTAVELRRARLAGIFKSFEYMNAEYAASVSGTLDRQLNSSLELSEARTALKNDEDALKSARAAFKAALGLSREVESPPEPAYPDKYFSADSADLWAEAEKANPELAVLRAAADSAAASVRVAETSELPDFEFGLKADAKASPVMYRPSVKMTLPIWRDKIESYINSAKSGAAAASARLDAARIDLAAELARAEYEASENARIADFIAAEALPSIDASIKSAAAGYGAGTTGIARAAELETLRATYAIMRADAERGTRKARSQLRFLILGAIPEGAEYLHPKE